MPSPTFAQRLYKLAGHRLFDKVFAGVSLAVLLLTTCFWAVLSAGLQEVNADQFIDAYLFESADTFQHALFPGAHTFLIKWPLFALMQLYGHSWIVFTGMTLLMTLATVGALAYLLYRIEHRPLLFGLLCLGLASVLLLIPAQPHPGALLPSNFAMTTTRNLEYAVLLACLWLVVRAPNLRHAYFWAAAGLLGLLVASDKLFGVLALGGVLFLLVGYALLLRRRYDLRVGLRALAMTMLAIVFANVLLVAIVRLDITNVVNETNASPFPLISSGSQLVQGVLYGAMAVLTNFGANPVHEVVVIREFPRALLASLVRPSIVAYLVNLALLGFAVYAAFRTMRTHATDTATRLTVLLCGSTLAALTVFVLTDHYFPVDSRYLAIELFALTVAAAAYIRGRQWRLRTVAAAAGVLLLALPFGMYGAWQEYRMGRTAVSGDATIYAQAAQALDRQGTKQLLGDYWKVTPVKAQTKKDVTIAPVDNCAQPRQVLSSNAWYDLPKTTPSAYLAVRDPGKLTYQGCTLANLVSRYGTPSERVQLQANPDSPSLPNALLLLYGQGFKPLTTNKPEAANAKTEPPKEAVPAGPKTLVPLYKTGACSRGTTLAVVAHQDDDILFMNPDLGGDIAARRCIRTVYLTAGDAGAGESYWASREQGAKAAYAQMYGGKESSWRDERQMVGNHMVTVSYLSDAPHIALVFLRLPDGNMRGQGFLETGNASLRALYDGAIPAIKTVDDGTEYTREQLVQALADIMAADLPDRVYTQGSEDIHDGDHSDHHAAGSFAKLAREQYKKEHALSTYLGYPDKSLPVNLTDDQITLKQITFMVYAKFDGAVCQTAYECEQTLTYGSYLTRQYKTTDAPPLPQQTAGL